MKVQIPFFIESKPLEPEEETAALFSALAMADIAAFKQRKRKDLNRKIPYIISGLVLSLGLLSASPSSMPIGIIGIILTACMTAIFINSNMKMQIENRITGIGKFYWKIALVPFRDGSIMLDLSSILPKTNFRYTFLGQEDMQALARLKEEAQPLYADSRMFLDPAIKETVNESFTVYGTEKQLADSVQASENVLSRAGTKEVNLPIILPSWTLANTLGSLLASASPWNPEKDSSLLEVENEDTLMDRFRELSGLADADDATPIDQDISDWLDQLASFASRHEDLLTASLRSTMRLHQKTVIDDCRHISQNHYCPQCHSEVANGHLEDYESYTFDENTRMNYNSATNEWECSLCRFRTSQPIRIPRIFDEVIFPVVKALMLEHKTERLRIYSDIENHKSVLKTNFENNLEKAFQANRDGIEEANVRVRALKTGINQDIQMGATLLALLQKFKKISEDRYREYEAAMNGVRSDIQSRTAESIKQFGLLMERIQDRARKDLDKNAKLARDLELKRDRQFLISVAAAKGERVIIKNENGHSSVTYKSKENTVSVEI